MINRHLPFAVIFLTGSLFIFKPSLGQKSTDTVSQVYSIKKKVDIPVTAALAGWTSYGFSQISKKEGTSEATLAGLQKSDVNGFDRWAIRPYSKSVDKLSYVPFYIGIPLPLILFTVDKKMRKDFWKLSFLYLEAMSITGSLYTSAVHYHSRYRPLVYSTESPMEKRMSPNSTNSFFAGHVALVATSTFFAAQVLADYHPDSRLKWVYYGSAAALTAATAYLRVRAGEHFPSDVLIGTAVGTLSGWLTPKLHRTKLFRDHRMTILPYGGLYGSHGLAALYKL